MVALDWIACYCTGVTICVWHLCTIIPSALEDNECMYQTQFACSRSLRQISPQVRACVGCRHWGNPHWWKNSHSHKALGLPAECVMRYWGDCQGYLDNFPPLWQRKDTKEFIQGKGDRWLLLQSGTTEKWLNLHYSHSRCDIWGQAVLVYQVISKGKS